MKVAVLGGGNGAFALAFDLAQAGNEVLIYVTDEFKSDIEGIRNNSGKLLAKKEYNGCVSDIYGETFVTKTTTSAKEAAEFAQYLISICPAFGQGPTFKSFLPFLTKNHVFVSMPGNFALFEYARIIQDQKKEEFNESVDLKFPCAFAECSTIPYACRKINGNEVFINGCKSSFQVGVYPSEKSDEITKSMRNFFRVNIVQVTNIIESGLYNLNIVFHPPGVIYNSGWIEKTNGNYLFYHDGFTPAICNVVKAMDDERLKIGKFFGFNIEDHLTEWQNWYPNENKQNELTTTLQNAMVYSTIKAPNQLKNRYITEDFPYLLVPIIECLAKPNGIETPASDAVISSAKLLTGLPLKCERYLDPNIIDHILKN